MSEFMFQITVPSGFMRLDLPLADDESIRAMILDLLSSGSKHRLAEMAGGLEAAIRSMADSLASQGFFLAYMAMPGTALSSIQPIFSARRWQVPQGMVHFDALCALTQADATAELLDLDPVVCLRTAHEAAVDLEAASQSALETLDLVVPPENLEGVRLSRVQLTYHLGIPSQPESWYQMVGVATVPALGGDDPPIATAQNLFDGFVSTFKWVTHA